MVLSERWRVSDAQIEHLVRQTSKAMSSSETQDKAGIVSSKGSLSWAPPSSIALPPIHEAKMPDVTCLPRMCLDHQIPIERRGSQMLSRPQSKESTGSRRSSSTSGSDRNGRVKIQVYVPESGDTFSLLVPPDALIGPLDAMENANKKNRFTEMFGALACTNAFDKAPYSFDHKKREWGPKQTETPRTDDSDKESVTLKGLIEHFTGVEPKNQRLYFRGTPVSMPGATIMSYRITEGATVQLHLFRRRADTPAGESLRPLAKNQGVRYQQQSKFSVKNVAQFQGANPGGEFWPMPRWVSQQKPKLFSSCGIGLDGLGGVAPYQQFENTPIFVDRKWK